MAKRKSPEMPTGRVVVEFLAPHEHNGVKYARGDRLNCTPDDARMLNRHARVKRVSEVAEDAAMPEAATA